MSVVTVGAFGTILWHFGLGKYLAERKASRAAASAPAGAAPEAAKEAAKAAPVVEGSSDERPRWQRPSKKRKRR
jgi:hypothetical protein